MNNLNGTIIWENPNPNTSFDAKTISIDMTPYEGKLIEIEFTYDGSMSNSRVLCHCRCEFGNAYFFNTGNADVIITRRVKPVSGGLEVYDAYRYGTNGSLHNAYMIPRKVTVLPF